MLAKFTYPRFLYDWYAFNTLLVRDDSVSLREQKKETDRRNNNWSNYCLGPPLSNGVEHQ